MKRLPFVLLLVFAASLTAAAQQKSEQADNKTPTIRIKTLPYDISISGPTFVFVDGAVYVEMLATSVLVPMSGGGASGCFTLDLPQRRERLMNLIERFPPTRGAAPATRQLEAYAM